MPWEPKDASRHTSKADSPRKKALWSRVANDTLERSEGDEGKAVRIANYVTKRNQKRSSKRASKR